MRMHGVWLDRVPSLITSIGRTSGELAPQPMTLCVRCAQCTELLVRYCCTWLGRRQAFRWVSSNLQPSLLSLRRHART